MSAVLVLTLATGCAAEEPVDVPPVTEHPSAAVEPEVLPGPADGVEMTVADGLELTPEEQVAAEEAVEALRALLNLEDSVLRGSGAGLQEFTLYADGEALEELRWIATEYQNRDYQRKGAIAFKSFQVVQFSSEREVDLSYCADTSDVVVTDSNGNIVEQGSESSEIYLLLTFAEDSEGWKASRILEGSDACR